MAQQQASIARGEIVVLFEDECHLLWGDVRGWAWGKRNQPLEVPISNPKSRQTCYGTLNFRTQQFHLKPFPAGNGENTVADVKWLRELYPNAWLWLIWDGASYHRGGEMQACLTELNAGLPEDEWWVTCTLFAPNAPEQNPVEAIWLKGKHCLRKHFAFHQTFAKVKSCFFDFLDDGVFPSEKYDWYKPSLQII